MTDALFAHLEALQGGLPWGEVLDAGTGAHSLAWIAGLPTSRWTAVTASAEMREASLRAAQPRPQDRVVVGDWTDPGLLAGEAFDVVIADYLLGAVDGFAPYFQDRLFERLRPHVRGRLYALGQEPDLAAHDAGGALVMEIARVRDAAILLAGDRCYREYPMDWVERHLARAGFVVEEARKFPILRDARFVVRQLDVARQKLPRLRDRRLAAAYEATLDDLRARGLALTAKGRIRYGADWVISARPS